MISLEAFEKDYEIAEREINVLRHEGGGGSGGKGFMTASAYFLAYYDIKTQSYFDEEGRLEWPLTEEEEETRSYFNRFKDNTIYRVKVRFLKNRTVPEGMLSSLKNKFYVVEVLEENAKCPQLEQRLKEYQAPITLKDDVLGELEFDKRFSTFEGSVLWNNKKIRINLEVDQLNKATWTKARKAMKEMYEKQEKWDKEMRSFAAVKLTSLANDWEAQEDKSIPEITEEGFAMRIQITNIVMSSGGSFVVYFEDDGMFLGHCVTVYGSLKKGIKQANMEG